MSTSHDATSWFGTGPSHGIQLKNPKYAGRLVVGAYENSTSTKQLAGVYYSDDFGKTWKVSEEDNALVANKIKPTEPSVVELLNGDVYIGARSERPGTEPHRTRALSKDGGATLFNETAPDGTTPLPPHKPVPSLVTPQIQASLLALEKTYQQTAGDTLIAAPPSPSRTTSPATAPTRPSCSHPARSPSPSPPTPSTRPPPAWASTPSRSTPTTKASTSPTPPLWTPTTRTSPTPSGSATAPPRPPPAPSCCGPTE
ncbi:hypothetical protein [Streptomyces erythrochromogenes]|uniref:hypothetical protein n=1 Tax=Streptomyces erythrochromogenes TaxID=285574 RepID=UPI0037D3275D